MTRISSPRRQPWASGARVTVKSRPLASALARCRAVMVATHSPRSNGARLIGSCPASMRLMSRMSVSTCSSRRPDATTRSAVWRPRSVVCSPASRLESAITPFSGVRNSWLILARKSVLAALACCSSAVRACTRSSSPARISSPRRRSSPSLRASWPISSSRPARASASPVCGSPRVRSGRITSRRTIQNRIAAPTRMIRPLPARLEPIAPQGSDWILALGKATSSSQDGPSR